MQVWQSAFAGFPSVIIGSLYSRHYHRADLKHASSSQQTSSSTRRLVKIISPPSLVPSHLLPILHHQWSTISVWVLMLLKKKLHWLPNVSSFTNVFHILPQSLLKLPLIRPKTLLAVSSLVHRFCQRERTPCSQIPEVQELVLVLKEDLRQSCGGQEPLPITEVQPNKCCMPWEGWYIELTDASFQFLLQLLHVLKAVENIGLPEFIPQLKICIHNHSAPVELRLAVVQAFRHIPCHRKVCIYRLSSITLLWTHPAFLPSYFLRVWPFARSQAQAKAVWRLRLVLSPYEATKHFLNCCS